jgi:D-glycero-alpha-D-manno-heptose-7-phosphate kinase
MLFRAKAPLRVSFAGGGTDVAPFPEREGGLVLNATINRYAYGTLRPRDDDAIHVESVDFGETARFGFGESMALDGRLDLVKAASRRLGGLQEGAGGFDLLLHSNAPPGSGLGSSSTTIVTLIGLLKEFRSVPLTDYEIAQLAYEVERVDLGLEGGLQDQYAATFGGFNFLELEAGRVVVNPLRIPADTIMELEHNLLLAYTGRTSQGDRIIEDQTERFEEAEADAMDGLRTQKQLALDMKNALLQRRVHDFGDLLDQAWQAKKRMSDRISSDDIDEMYEEATKVGALGGNVTGAGGGGYMLFYCRYDRKHRVADRLGELGASVTEFAFEPEGLRTWRADEH